MPVDETWKAHKDDVFDVVADLDPPSARIEYAFKAGYQQGEALVASLSADWHRVVKEHQRLLRLLDRAYPWLHNPYRWTSDFANDAEAQDVIRSVEQAIAHLKEEPDPLLSLPCGSCDGTGKIETVIEGNAEQVICPSCAPIRED
jgi:hypothetical protein